ncbi:MAG: response regulator [Thermoanaerobaculaceae bacterium]|nr:response regulator [Thermoanaerobaculaceae bacterium]
MAYIKEKSPDSKVIIMTGYCSPDIQDEAYEKGAYCYFEKPVDLRVLIEKIDSIRKVEKKKVEDEE